VIFRDDEGIKAGLPVPLNPTIRTCRRPRPPEGAKAMADYHSHVDTSEFSEFDMTRRFDMLAHYLCAPNGLVRKMTREGSVILR